MKMNARIKVKDGTMRLFEADCSFIWCKKSAKNLPKFTLNKNCKNFKNEFFEKQKQIAVLFFSRLQISAFFSSRWAALCLPSKASVLSLVCVERTADCIARKYLWYEDAEWATGLKRAPPVCVQLSLIRGALSKPAAHSASLIFLTNVDFSCPLSEKILSSATKIRH